VNEHLNHSRLIVTPGEPAGIGPDITLQIAAQKPPAEFYVLADPDLMRQRAQLLKLDIEIVLHENIPNSPCAHQTGQLNMIPVSLKNPAVAGKLDPANSSYVLECLRLAAEYCTNNSANAMVTGPVHKGVINEAGIDFTGHTEFLAELNNSKPVMMLATESLRVALATTHLPLRNVSDAITRDSIEYIINTLHAFLAYDCNIKQPVILVCGLNPHAGEGGHLGSEEIEIITPAIEACNESGLNIIGPLPADTAFTQTCLNKADAILAMYHDQGLPVLKHTGFGEAVNITLGLPFIRTSVDHGTALDLSGSGKANVGSILAAMKMATNLLSTQ